MTARVREVWANLTSPLASLSPARRLLVAAAGVGLLVVVLGLAWWAQQPLLRPLFTNFDSSDAGRGLSAGGDAGFGSVDKTQLEQTDFQQHLNYQSTLQGELGRTIGELGGVESARVHLGIPERSLGVSPDRPPSASVVVKLVPGHALARAQIDGIVHLVAASVQGMAPDAVTVVDEGGRRLTAEASADAIASQNGAVGYQRAIEGAIEERIESLLATVVGAGNVIARVAASVDFSRTERTEETFDPDKTVVRQNHSTREQTTGGTTAGAAAAVKGAKGAKGTGTVAGEPAGPRVERRDETQSYEVSKTVSHTVAPIGVVKSLSIAVLIDGTYREENGERVFVPRSAGELGQLKALAASAAGLSETRGDRLEVTSAPFQTPEPAAPATPLARAIDWLPTVLGRLFGIGLVLGVLAVVVRPVVRAIATAGSTAESRRVDPTLDRDTVVSELARENVALAQQNPERAAQLVRQWLVDGGQRTV